VRAEERAIAAYVEDLADEWELDTSDFLVDAAPSVRDVDVELHDLFDEDWNSPTREVQIHAARGKKSGFFLRQSEEPTILDAGMLIVDLKRRHDALPGWLRTFEVTRLGGHPSRRAAWGVLAGRFADVARLVDALGALCRTSQHRGALELFVPSRPLAAYVTAAYTYTERVLDALAALAGELERARPNWQACQRRITDARTWLVVELFEEVRTDLALMALQIGEPPVGRVSEALRKAALTLGDVDAVLAGWLG